MPKGSTFDNDFLKLIFNATTITGLARDDTGSFTTLYVALHTADPSGSGNDQTTNEATTGQYNTYARVGVARTTGGWTVTTNSVSPVSAITWSSMVSGTGCTITHWSVGVASSGASKLLYSGTVTPNIVMSAGNAAQLNSSSTVTET